MILAAAAHVAAHGYAVAASGSGSGVDWPAWGAVALSVVSGALVLSWRLGGLERAVRDLGERVGRLEARPTFGRRSTDAARGAQ